VAALLGRRRRPSALFCANDLMAIGAMSALREAGLAVPADVAVVGFDDTPIAALLTPALTSVRQDEQMIGVTAARMVVERLAGAAGTSGRAVVLPYHIVERASA
jgi:DNA-binding LacI/PurR family transcriptional regulator